MKRTPEKKAAPVLPDAARRIVKPFPLRAIKSPEDAPHDLGPIQTPAEMAKHVPAGGRWEEKTIEDAAGKALAALVGSGPKQTQPHLSTALHLREGLDRLRDHALAGDTDAMSKFGELLCLSVADLGEMARRHPEIVRKWSRKQNVVPVLTGKNVGHGEELAAALDAFAVGTDTPYKINPKEKRGGKTFSTRTPIIALAGGLCAHLRTHRYPVAIMKPPVPEWARMASRLPELDTATSAEWADAAWECLMSATGSQPEKETNLGDNCKEVGPGSVRQRIKQLLREAINRMAAPVRQSE